MLGVWYKIACIRRYVDTFFSGCLRGYAYISFHELPPGKQCKEMQNKSIGKRASDIQAQQRNNIYQPNHKISVDIVVTFYSISVAEIMAW